MKLALITAGVLALATVAVAQNYKISPEDCGATTQLLSCNLVLSPASQPLLISPRFQISDVSLVANTNNTGYIQFANVLGPDGYVSSAQVTSTTLVGNQVTMTFSGYYAPASGSGPFTGTATFTFSIKEVRINRWKPLENHTFVTSGTVAIN